MFWIALQPPHEDDFTAWGWHALRFTPRVARVDEAILIEASASERLWGGRKALLRELLVGCKALARSLSEAREEPAASSGAATPRTGWAAGETSLAALALLRLKLGGAQRPARIPQDLPLPTLTAVRDHVATLARTGCNTWGELRSLPRAGVARRFGAALLDALDAAWGERPERYEWIELPEAFDMKHELMALATGAPELMWTAQRLLTQLQAWLQARNRGVLALELEWTLDLRRLNGVRLPSHEQLVVRTAQPTQDIAHLRRLVGEHLARASLAAPANHLRLRSLETVPWGGADKSLLPEDNVQGERLHEFVERVSARLGAGSVVMPCLKEDHRPERMQAWVEAKEAGARDSKSPASADALYPPWLLPEPLELAVRNNVPHYGGPLSRLTRIYRVETGWWEDGQPALRDYYIARSDSAGLVWIYRERPSRQSAGRWYLQGLYA